MKKLQDPRSKIQRSSKSQAPSGPVCASRILELGAWCFSGAWSLELGTSARARSLCALALVLSLCSSEAQTNTSPPGNRYLFVVETSRSMQSRSEGTLRAVQQLLNSGMGGQLRRGDTLGVWTYNDTLFAGKFRLQLWSPETHASTVANVVGFLQQQTYEKNGRLEKVLPALDRVIKDSPFLTIILVSGGEQEIHGT